VTDVTLVLVVASVELPVELAVVVADVSSVVEDIVPLLTADVTVPTSVVDVDSEDLRVVSVVVSSLVTAVAT